MRKLKFYVCERPRDDSWNQVIGYGDVLRGSDVWVKVNLLMRSENDSVIEIRFMILDCLGS